MAPAPAPGGGCPVCSDEKSPSTAMPHSRRMGLLVILDETGTGYHSRQRRCQALHRAGTSFVLDIPVDVCITHHTILPLAPPLSLHPTRLVSSLRLHTLWPRRYGSRNTALNDQT